MRRSFLCIFACLAVLTAGAQEPVGIFDDHSDIGLPDVPGLADFEDGTYTVDAVGAGMDGFNDQLHYVYSSLSGSFSVQASPFVAGGAGRGGVMIRQSLEDDSAHASLMMTGDLNVWPHIRSAKGGGVIFDGDPADATTVSIRLERLGNSLYLYRINEDGSEDLLNTEVFPLEETVLAGLAASGDGQFGLVEFTDVSIELYPLNVMRSLPDGFEYEPGASISQVTVTASVREGETVDATVTEVTPRGSSVSNVQASAGTAVDNGDGTISWDLAGLSGEAALTYDVALPNRASVAWQGTFSDGERPESHIGGAAVLPAQPAFTGPPAEPIEIDPFFPVVIQVEAGENVADPDAWGLGLDPRVESGITIINVNANASDLIEIPINIPEDGTYWLFGNVRGEDGNSDSMHFDIDIPPAGDESTRWNTNSAKAFQLDWVEREDPSEDPRPFDLTAGEHFIYIAGREDAASIDYVAVTTNPNLDLGNFNPDVNALVSRSISDVFLEGDETSAEVEVQAVLRGGTADSAIIVETPPSNMNVSNATVSDGALTENADGSLSWDITGITGQELTLSYEVSPAFEKQEVFTTARFDGEFTLGSAAPLEYGGGDSIVVEGSAVDPSGLTAFLFQNVGANELGDQVMISHMQNRFGLEIQRFDDTNAAGFEMPGDLNGADFAIVSGSVGSGNVANQNYHVNSPEPIVTYESFLVDDFAFQSGVGQTGSDPVLELEIVDNGHPITEGYDLGTVQVYTEPHGLGVLSNPPGGVRVLATVPGDPTSAVLWVIEAGTEVNGTTSPGVRIAYFAGGGAILDLTAAGIDLLDRSIAYSLGIEPPAPPTRVAEFMLY